MGAALKWGLISVGSLLGSVLLVALLYRLIGLTLTLVFLGLAIPTFLVTLTVVLVRRAVRFGIGKFKEITRVPESDHFDSAASFEADLRQATDGANSSDELQQAAERIRRIKTAAHSLHDRAAGRAMERVADAARTLLLQAGETRSAARRLRHPLVHQLGHVEAVALNLMRMQEGGAPDPALTERATATFLAVASDFERHRRSTAAAHALETEARLELLSQEVDAGVRGATIPRQSERAAGMAPPQASPRPQPRTQPETKEAAPQPLPQAAHRDLETVASVTPMVDEFFNRNR